MTTLTTIDVDVAELLRNMPADDIRDVVNEFSDYVDTTNHIALLLRQGFEVYKDGQKLTEDSMWDVL